MSKFGSLAANVTTASRMQIIYPATGKPIVDESGKAAYIDLLSQDSAVARQHAKKKAAEQIKRVITPDDPNDLNDAVDDQIDMLAVLAVGWHLVDPATRKPIEFPFNGPESARELFATLELQWLRRAAYVHVVNTANFMKASPKS